MAFQIHRIAIRKALAPRREPYWGAPLGQGRYLGLRKVSEDHYTWVARFRTESGEQRYRSLGQATPQFDHGAAVKAAERWFADAEEGVALDGPATVAQACEAYVKHLADKPGKAGAAADAAGRFRRLVYGQELGRLRVDRLTRVKIEAWLHQQQVGRGTQNRNLTALRAALNHAVDAGLVSATRAQQWRAVKPHRKADGRRSVYLTREQRRALVDACEGALRDLVLAAALTGARPGELVALTRRDFDKRLQTLTLRGKTGPRTIPLSPAAATLFTRLARGKLPPARLLVMDNGEPWYRERWHGPIREAAERAGLPRGVVLYSLRHAFISALLEAGAPTLEVARICGTSISMVQANYGHLAEHAMRDRLAGVQII